jgi:protoheme IX farnesyltransferase
MARGRLGAAFLRRLAASLELCKLPVGLLAAATAGAGHVLYRHQVSPAALFTAAGVMLLACGAATLNNWQDRHLDRLMHRTARRALPSGRLTPRWAVIQAALLLAGGLAVLAGLGETWLPLLGGLAAVLCYNGVYTPLKRRTPLAVLPGSISGMLAAAIGWTAAGGLLPRLDLALLLALVFIWQMPHFWVIVLARREDFARARLPHLIARLGEAAIRRLTVTWVCAYACLAAALVIFGAVRSDAGSYALLANLALLVTAAPLMLLSPTRDRALSLLRGHLGLSQVLLLGLIIAGA